MLRLKSRSTNLGYASLLEPHSDVDAQLNAGRLLNGHTKDDISN